MLQRVYDGEQALFRSGRKALAKLGDEQVQGLKRGLLGAQRLHDLLCTGVGEDLGEVLPVGILPGR